jgi:hypothetical protein
MRKTLRIPGAMEWSGYEADLDVRDAHRMMFGKRIEEVQQYFGDVHSISRADELLFMPRGAFQYYVLAFAEFVSSERARGDSDSASSFLRLLLAREERDPGSVSRIYDELAPVVEFVAENQPRFEAAPEIYGDFRELADKLRKSCGA